MRPLYRIRNPLQLQNSRKAHCRCHRGGSYYVISDWTWLLRSGRRGYWYPPAHEQFGGMRLIIRRKSL